MAGNTMSLEFAGDATKLQKAGEKSSDVLDDVGASATQAADDFNAAGQESTKFTDQIGKLGAGISGMTDAVDTAGSAVQAMSDIQQAGRERAMRLARAQADVEQAMIDQEQAAVDLEQATLDLNQAQLDGKQAAVDETQAVIDRKQAMLDADTAMKAYNEAVKEHGKGSDEAKQALIDLAQANVDVKQANVDLEQAQADASQAITDGKQATVDATQAVRDGKDAQLDLNDAMSEANPTGLQKWADNINLVSPLLSSLVGIVGLATGAQWAWNAAMIASPIGLIIAAVVAVIAVIVLIATKTTWFQDVWGATWRDIKKVAGAVGSWFRDTLWGKWIKPAWDGILNAGKSTWNWLKLLPNRIKDAFASVKNFLFAPFRSAFNLIADAWNNTVGRLHWTAPAIFGGWSIDVPDIPKFHSGGRVPGPPGSEMLAILEGGEQVIPRGGGGGVLEIRSGGSQLDDLLVEILSRSIRRRGGNVQLVLGGRNA